MIARWHVPSWSGDFRLKASVDEKTSVLEVVNPTPAEVVVLREFLAAARARGWVDPADGIAKTGRCELDVGAPVVEAGPVLLAAMGNGRGRLTAVASERGIVVASHVLVDGADPLAEPALVPDVVDRPKKGRKKKSVGDVLKDALGLDGDDERPTDPGTGLAATVERPHLQAERKPDCPDTRASEVLHAFSTEQQWATWMDAGWMEVVGGRSGHVYQLAHRKSERAQRRGRVAFDCIDGVVLDAFLWTVPPAEEVLSLKLWLEHAEEWVRNPAGIDTMRATDVFPHPMGVRAGMLDGRGDQRFLSTLEGVANLYARGWARRPW